MALLPSRREQTSHVRVMLSDTGRGMSPEEQAARRAFVQFSAPHFEAVAGNLLNLFVSVAPSNAGRPVELLGDYKHRSTPDYLQAVGGSVLRVAQQVPHGLLVYFASTTALHTAVDRRAMYVREADEAVLIGPDDPDHMGTSPYLDHAELERALRATAVPDARRRSE